MKKLLFFLTTLMLISTLIAQQAIVQSSEGEKVFAGLKKKEPDLYGELIKLSTKSQKFSEYTQELQGTPFEELDATVLREALFNAARDTNYKYEKLIKEYPAISKETGVIGIIEGNKIPSKLLFSLYGGWYEMVFDKNGTNEWVTLHLDERPETTELKKIEGKDYLILHFWPRALAEATNRTEIIQYILIDQDKLTLLDKQEEKKAPFKKKINS